MTDGEGLNIRGEILTPEQQARALAAIAAQGLNGGADTLVTLFTRAANLAPRDY